MAGYDGPWIVAGMHRSGTSLVASTISLSGVDLGERLLPADKANPRGYYEDCDFLDLDRRMLLAATERSELGHADWGWVESERLHVTAFEAFRREADQLVAARAARARTWGFKDPRASLMLDFWLSVAPGARFVLPYRLPWEVADSMQRLGEDVFLSRPEMAYRIWSFYNRRLLDFHRRHRDRSVLVSIDAAVRDPARFGEVLRQRLDLVVVGAQLAERYEPEALRLATPDDPIAPLAGAAHPDCVRLLEQLDAESDLPASGLWRNAPPRARHRATEPRVAVVIPCCGDGELLIEAVASVERSIESPYELVVVDDGSRHDPTVGVLAMLATAGYDVRRREHAGVGAARNHGFSVVRAPFVIPLDADNRLLPGFVDRALDVLDREPAAGAVYGDRLEFGKRTGRVHVGHFDAARLVARNYVDTCAVIRSETWLASGGYDEHMPIQGWEDWDLWLAMIARGWQLHWLPFPGFEYRVRPNSMLRDLESNPTLPDLARYVVGKHHDLYLRTLKEQIASRKRDSSELARTAAELATASNELVEERRAIAELSARAATYETELEEARREACELAHQARHLEEQLAALETQQRSLHASLRSWRDRTSALEATRALRIRRRALRLRSRWERRDQTGPAHPCVIGGTGGSGTRVFARIAAIAGLSIGEDRNEFEDALPIEHFLDEWLVPFWKAGGSDPPHVAPAGMDEAFAAALTHQVGVGNGNGPRGWKSPRSIYVLPFLSLRCPDLRFLHVVRDGRDIALSTNQLQLERYGAMLLPPDQQTLSLPERSIALWSRVNLWAAYLGAELGLAYIRVRFEDLTASPEVVSRRIVRFFDLPGDPRAAARVVDSPSSLGRWRRAEPQLLSRLEDLGGAALRQFGYL